MLPSQRRVKCLTATLGYLAISVLRGAGRIQVACDSNSGQDPNWFFCFQLYGDHSKQSNRHGANVWVSLLEFLHCLYTEGDLSCFNISVALMDEFMMQARDPTCTTPWMCEWKGEKMRPRRIKRDRDFRVVDATLLVSRPNKFWMKLWTLHGRKESLE